MTDDEMRQFKVYLPAGLIRRLKHAAVETEQSLSAFVADAVEGRLEHLGRGEDASGERTEDEG